MSATLFIVVAEQLRTKDEELKKVLEDKAKILVELRVSDWYFYLQGHQPVMYYFASFLLLVKPMTTCFDQNH